MPELSRFLGISIYMYNDDHNPPHFHALYGDNEAIYDLNERAFIKGYLPTKQARFVLAWADMHNEELFENWNNLQNGKGIIKITPLA